jgi:hypothetical protein
MKANRDQANASTKGLLAELQFELECLRRGFTLSKPVHPKCVYDYVLESEGKFLKIQVKYTSCKNPSGNFRLTCAKGSTSDQSKRQVYKSSDIDYFAGLTEAGDWYLIPIKASVSTAITLCHKYAKFKNNWRIK